MLFALASSKYLGLNQHGNAWCARYNFTWRGKLFFRDLWLFFLNTEHVLFLYNLSIHAKPSQVQLLRSVDYLFVFLPRNMILSLFMWITRVRSPWQGSNVLVNEFNGKGFNFLFLFFFWSQQRTVSFGTSPFSQTADVILDGNFTFLNPRLYPWRIR